MAATLAVSNNGQLIGTVSFTFIPGGTYAFMNSSAITVPEFGTGTPYPSTITVSGLSGAIGKVTATLSNLAHAYPGDLNILLVAPGGQKSVLMSEAGGGNGLTGVTLTFDDGAVSNLPPIFTIVPGTYKPTDNLPGDDYHPAPAPAGPYAAPLSVFNGGSPNGIWSLFVYDEFFSDSGNIANGWSLALTTVGTVNPVPPALSQPTVTTNNQLRFLLTGTPGDTYHIEASTNLLNWTAISTNTMATNTMLFTHPQAVSAFPQRFYRAWRRP